MKKILSEIFFVPLIRVLNDISELKMLSRVILILFCGWSCIVEILQQSLGEKKFLFFLTYLNNRVTENLAPRTSQLLRCNYQMLEVMSTGNEAYILLNNGVYIFGFLAI